MHFCTLHELPVFLPKNIFYFILFFIFFSGKNSKGDTDVYNGLLDSEGEGEGGMIWENDILTCILSCKN